MEEGGRNEARALRPDPFSTYFVILSHVVDLLAAERERENHDAPAGNSCCICHGSFCFFFPFFDWPSAIDMVRLPPILSVQSVGGGGGE